DQKSRSGCEARQENLRERDSATAGAIQSGRHCRDRKRQAHFQETREMVANGIGTEGAAVLGWERLNQTPCCLPDRHYQTWYNWRPGWSWGCVRYLADRKED